MNLYPGQFYYLYNRGNNNQRIFFSQENQLFFLCKVREAFQGQIDCLAYWLMPNHFHFLVYSKDNFNSEIFLNRYRLLYSTLLK